MKFTTMFLTLLLLFQDWTTGSTDSNKQVLVLHNHPRGKRAVLLPGDGTESCRIYGQDEAIEMMETDPNGPVVRSVNETTWTRVANECKKRIVRRQVRAGQRPRQLDFIYPGTKWCGTGDIAQSFDDVGPEHPATDRCCRDHDFCFDTMKPRTCKHGLCNDSPFTKSHCDCDDRMYQCLMNAISDSASMSVGFVYFDIGAISCFRPISSIRGNESCLPASRSNQAGNETGWCFIAAKPFKKVALLRGTEPVKLQQQRSGYPTAANPPPGVMIKHVFSTIQEVKSAAKIAAVTALTGRRTKREAFP